MNEKNEINEFVEKVVYKKINNILNIISESYLKIKYIDENLITKIEKQELSLHKVKQYKLLSELCNKDNNIKIKDLKEPKSNIQLSDILQDDATWEFASNVPSLFVSKGLIIEDYICALKVMEKYRR